MKEAKKKQTQEKPVEAKPVKEQPVEEQKPEEQKSEEQPKKQRGIFLKVFLGVLLASAIGILIFFILKKEFNTLGFRTSRKLDYGVEYQEDFGRVCYGSVFGCKDVEFEASATVDTKELGEHEITVLARSGDQTIELKQIVTVVDETPPEIATDVEQLKVCPNGKIPAFNYSIQDNFDGDLTDSATIIHNQEQSMVIISIEDSNKNATIKTIPATVSDDEAPVITMNGDETVSAYIGGAYNDAGASVVDNCDDVELKTNNHVTTNTIGTYNVEYSATDNSGNTATKKRIVEVKQPENGIIYLTFDDGPGAYTGRLLDILKKYNVKATFFVTGSGSDDLLRREYNEGHSIGLHTFTHAYDYIYQDEGTFFSDLERVQNRVKNATGYTSMLMRFPGGSSNTVSAKYDGGQKIMSKLVKSVQERGFTYFDWNITSGDAGGAYTSTQVYNNVISRLGHGGSYVVLQHDIKGFSVDAVEGIINYGLSHGYVFLPLTTSSFAAHHGVNN